MTNHLYLNGKEEPKPSSVENENITPNSEPVHSIGKVAKQYNVSLRTLRFYESCDLLHPLHRGKTRLYRTEDCRRIEMILRGKQFGFSIAEIHDLLLPRGDKSTVPELESRLTPDDILSKIKALQQRRDDLERAIEELNKMQKSKS